MNKLIQNELNKYVTFLKAKDVRLSKGRQVVFNRVMQWHGHFTGEQMAKACGENSLNVSRATVYRCLHELLEAGIVRETAFGDKHRHYEHLYDERKHHHAICVKCHEHIEFPDLDEDLRYHGILAKKGFKILGHEMHFYGLCKECRHE